MKKCYLVGVLVFAAGALPDPGLAGELLIQTDPNLAYASAKCVNSTAFIDVYVIYVPGPGEMARAVEFAAPTPAGCVSVAGRLDEPVFTTIGESVSGVTIDFGGCISSPTHILTVRLVGVSVSADCCEWRAISSTGGQSPTAWDCDNNPVLVQSLPLWFSTEPCQFVAPHSPVPADGALIGALSTELQWQSSGGPVCDLGDVLIHNLYFGTDPNALVETIDTGSPHPVSGLLPATTYYWRVDATTYNEAGPYSGPLWSFTTQGPVAAEASTWGRIKSLFR